VLSDGEVVPIAEVLVEQAASSSPPIKTTIKVRLNIIHFSLICDIYQLKSDGLV